MPREDFVVGIKAQGAPETAKAFQDVSAAQCGVTEATTDSADAAGQAATAVEGLEQSQDAAHFSANAWAGSLQRLDPRLGELIRLSDYAARSVASLGSALTGGVVLSAGLGFMAAMRALRAETERITQAYRDQSAALNELEARRRGLSQTIESLSDRRRDGGMDAETAREASRQAERIRERFPALSEGVVASTVATFADEGFDDERMGRAAVAAQVSGTDFDPADRRSNLRLESLLSQHREAIDAFIIRETEQQLEQARQAMHQLRAMGGQTLDARRLVEQALGPGTSEDLIERIMEDIARVGSVSGLERAVERVRGFRSIAALPFKHVPFAAESEDGVVRYRSEEFMAQLDIALRHLERTADRAEAAMRGMGDARPSVIYNYQGARFFGSDGKAEEKRRTNGQTRARELEIR